MQIVRIDDTNTVVEEFNGSYPLLVQLSDRFCVAPPHVKVGWTLDTEAGKFNPPARKRWITNLAFDNRFTIDERVRIELAATLDPSMDQAQKEQAMKLRVRLDRAKKATYTDLDRVDTREGVQMFEAANLLDAPGRALIILDGPIAEHEYIPGA